MQRTLVLAFAGALAIAPLALLASPAPAPGQGLTPTQLPRDIRPIHYEISVAPDAAAMRFNGRAVITIAVRAPTRRVTLNAAGLSFERVRVSAAAAGSRELQPVNVSVDAAAETATFSFARRLAPGTYRMAIDYRGAIASQAEGLFAVDYSDAGATQRALFTQFENASARRFMPSWDEPAYKATFTLEATVPAAQMAVSNMPVAAVEPLPGALRRVRFAQSPKMSSYLLFLGVGDFERAALREGATEFGVVTRRGATVEAGFALEASARIVADYGDYFGVPYPLPKLDNIAGPGGSQFFLAMENWGAIFTFERVLLLDPVNGTLADREHIFSTAAHEIAHQWFGDLVTMRWWNDIWLNEGFASWLGARETALRHPEWQTALGAVRRRADAMDLDAYRSTHPVVSEVESADQVTQSFDAITYSKAAAVIAMIEAYVGADTWREGVRRYIAAHAYGNTRSDELWQAISAAAGRPIDDIAGDFTRQPGIPLVRLERSRCDSGQTTIELTQGEFSNDHPDAAPLHWRVPVIARVAGEAPARTLLDGAASLVLPGCGAVVVNAGQTGYFRTWYAPDERAALRERFAALAVIDQLGVIDDFWALALAGRMPIDEALDLVARVPADADATLWASIAARFSAVDGLYRGEPVRRAAWRGFAIGRLAPVLARIGWQPRADEPVPVAALRGELIDTLARLDDEATLAEARRRYAARSTDPAAYPPPLRRSILEAVALGADAAAWDALHAAARSERDTLAKERLYRLLASAADEGLAGRALELAIGDEPGATIAAGMVGEVAERHPDLAFDFAMSNQARLRERISESARNRYYPHLAIASNEPAMVDKLGRLAAALPRASRQTAQAAMARVAFRVEVVRERLPQIDAWLRAHG